MEGLFQSKFGLPISVGHSVLHPVEDATMRWHLGHKKQPLTRNQNCWHLGLSLPSLQNFEKCIWVVYTLPSFQCSAIAAHKQDWEKQLGDKIIIKPWIPYRYFGSGSLNGFKTMSFEEKSLLFRETEKPHCLLSSLPSGKVYETIFVLISKAKKTALTFV